MKLTKEKIKKLWIKLGNITIDKDENTEQPFLHFPKGTFREDIWHWFDEQKIVI